MVERGKNNPAIVSGPGEMKQRSNEMSFIEDYQNAC